MKIGLMYNMVLEPSAGFELDFQVKYNMVFTELIVSTNVVSLQIFVNDVLVANGFTLSSPIIMSVNDVVKFDVVRDQFKISKFELIGNTLD